MNSIDHIPNNLYILLLSLNRRVFNPNDALKSLNLPSSHAKVLFYLIHNGANPISKVAKDLSISKPNMTPIVDKLVNDGYIERYCDDNDRRVILIKHTKSACNLFKSLETQVKNNIYNKIKVLDEKNDFDKVIVLGDLYYTGSVPILKKLFDYIAMGSITNCFVLQTNDFSLKNTIENIGFQMCGILKKELDSGDVDVYVL